MKNFKKNMVLTSLWEADGLNIIFLPLSDKFLALRSKKKEKVFLPFRVIFSQVYNKSDVASMNPIHRVHFKYHPKLDLLCKSFNHINQKSIEQLGKQLLVKTWVKVSIPPLDWEGGLWMSRSHNVKLIQNI